MRKKATDQKIGCLFICNFACKPGSVVDDHLSLLAVADKLGDKPLPPEDMCRANDPHTVLLRIGFTADLCYHRNG